MAASAPNLVIPVGAQNTQLISTYSVTASAALGTVFQGTITAFGPSGGSTTSFQVPISEVWTWYRTSVVGSPTTDAVVSTFVNGIPQVVYPTLSSLNEANLSPFSFAQFIKFPPGSTIASTITTLATAPATTYTQTVKYWVVRAPYIPGVPGG